MLKDCTFKVFAGALETGSVRAINAKGAADKLTRKEIDKLVDFVKTYRAKGLAFTRLTKDAESSSYEKSRRKKKNRISAPKWMPSLGT